MSELLTVNGLHILAGSRVLVSDIHLGLEAGEFLAIVGESGSGKSLTSLACCGLLPPELSTRGRVTFAGQSLLDLSKTSWRRLRRNGVAAIFQDPMSSLNPLMKVAAQLAEAMDGSLALDDSKMQMARQLLMEVGLNQTDRILNAYPFELSGGQQQRIMIAMALATNPRLLIADEPTTALDAFTQNQVIRLLKDLQTSRNMAIVMVTHDLSIVRTVADTIAVFHQGRCVESGEAGSVMGHPQHHYTRSLVHAANQRVERGPARENTTAPILVARNIAFRYPQTNVQALDDVSLVVPSSTCLGIVGASGSGKSTLAKVLIGAITAQSGSVSVCGMAAAERWRSTQANLAFARQCQYIFQDTSASLNPSHSVASTLRDALKIAGRAAIGDEIIAQLLDEVGLPAALMARRPHALSGGQRQRVVIARALAINPTVLVCDEPVSALDAHLQKQVVNLLIRLQQAHGIALVFIGHDLSLMEQFCDRLIVMDKGRLVEEGETARLLNNPQSAALRELVAHAFGEDNSETYPGSAENAHALHASSNVESPNRSSRFNPAFHRLQQFPRPSARSDSFVPR